MKTLKIFAFLGAALFLSGCYHPAQTPVAPPAVVEEGQTGLSAFNFGYNPGSLSANVGETINLSITSDGTHTFTINELGVDQRLSKGNNNVTFTPDKAGNFEYFCNIPGHKEKGMVGNLNVK